MEAKTEVEEAEFVQAQNVISVELKCPMQHGKRKVSFLEITMSNFGIADGVLNVITDMLGVSEHFPMDNVVKWRIDSHLVPPLVGHEFGSYEYSPYTYPERVGGYLGSYGNDKGCLGFLDSDMQITMMKDLEA